MAGGAGAGPAAIRIDPRHIVPDRALHDGQPRFHVDHVLGSVMLDIGDAGHAPLISSRGDGARADGRRGVVDAWCRGLRLKLTHIRTLGRSAFRCLNL